MGREREKAAGGEVGGGRGMMEVTQGRGRGDKGGAGRHCGEGKVGEEDGGPEAHAALVGTGRER